MFTYKKQIHKALTFILSLTIVISVILITPLTVLAATKWKVTGTGVRIRSAPNTSSTILGQVSNDYVTVNGKPVTGQNINGNSLWYNITYNGITGYLSGAYLAKEVTPEYNYDKSFEEQIAAFPESYKEPLRKLHAEYPNWKFAADNINMTLAEAVQLESTRKLTQTTSYSWRSMGLGSYDWATGKWATGKYNNTWFIASREVIEYYMDPRNFLNSTDVFAYVLLTYEPSVHTRAGVQKIVSGTFLANSYSDPKDSYTSYVDVIMAAASKTGVSPYFIASKIIQEQGTNGSSLCLGTYSGYEGYYNFFNIKATGSNVIVNGLNYAKTKGWDTRSKSIIGGAQFCADDYILQGQNNHFYMDYDIKNPTSLHEYAEAVHDAVNSAKKAADGYKNVKSDALCFLIPVYKNMPATVTALPPKSNNRNNYYFNSMEISGLTPSFGRYVYSYDLLLSSDAAIKIAVPSGASYVGKTQYSLKQGINTVNLTVKAESGYTTDYTISVNATKPLILNISFDCAHTYQNISLVPSSCNANGTKAHIKCTKCGKLYNSSYAEVTLGSLAIPADSSKHIFAEKTTDATCTENGSYLKYCTHCGAVEKSQTIAALGHNKNTVTVKRASLYLPETTLNYCSRCDSYQNLYTSFALLDLDRDYSVDEDDEVLFNSYLNNGDYSRLPDFDGNSIITDFDLTVSKRLFNKKVTYSAVADVNGDGKSNLKDLICLKKHIANISETDTDLNEDGHINAGDISFVKLFAFNYDVYYAEN